MKWTIVGGGIHAITIALELKVKGLKNKDLTIIDPHDVFCHQFDHRTQNISMPYLRSPIVHHVHPNPFHLKQYFKKMDYAVVFMVSIKGRKEICLWTIQRNKLNIID